MATTPQSILAAGNCNECYASDPFELQIMMVQLLRQWLLSINPSAVTTPQALLADGNCFMCYASNPFALQVMMAVLLKQIVDGGGGGGGTGQTLYYTGPDANSAGVVPANTALAAIAYSKDGSGPTMGWNPDTQLWT